MASAAGKERTNTYDRAKSVHQDFHVYYVYQQAESWALSNYSAALGRYQQVVVPPTTHRFTPPIETQLPQTTHSISPGVVREVLAERGYISTLSPQQWATAVSDLHSSAGAATKPSAWQQRWWDLDFKARVHWECYRCQNHTDWQDRFDLNFWSTDVADVHSLMFPSPDCKTAVEALQLSAQLSVQKSSPLKNAIRDFIVWTCIVKVTVRSEHAYLEEVRDAFHIDNLSTNLKSQMLQVFHHMVALHECPSAFKSTNGKSKRNRPRRPNPTLSLSLSRS